MSYLNEKAVNAHTIVKSHIARVADRFSGDERGQGSVEYVGIILVVVAIVGAVVAGASPVGEAILTKLTEAVNKIGGGGGGNG